jgi:hypothetical protein
MLKKAVATAFYPERVPDSYLQLHVRRGLHANYSKPALNAARSSARTMYDVFDKLLDPRPPIMVPPKGEWISVARNDQVGVQNGARWLWRRHPRRVGTWWFGVTGCDLRQGKRQTTFTQTLNSNLEDGWRTIGGVAVSPPPEGEGVIFYYQTMIKPTESEFLFGGSEETEWDFLG